MLRIKPLAVGFITAVSVFCVLLLGECFICDKLEKLNESVITGVSSVFLLLSVFAGGFVSALMAKGRGVIYGGAIAVAACGIMLVLYLILGGTAISTVLTRAAGCLISGVLGGAIGILVSNKNEYV